MQDRTLLSTLPFAVLLLSSWVCKVMSSCYVGAVVSEARVARLRRVTEVLLAPVPGVRTVL